MPAPTHRTQKGPDPSQFAHPFFTSTPPGLRPPTKYGTRLTDHIKTTLNKVPAPKGKSVMTLADIVGTTSAQAIENSHKLIFHATGDTGKSKDSPQGDVADVMTKDFNINQPAQSPAFFMHLGDVLYLHDKDQRLRTEFYEPYSHYPGKIIAIAGNHDGEVFPKSDPKSLKAFMETFCAASPKVAPIAGSILRETMTQPGVYWRLVTHVADFVSLYSNTAENPGYISGQIPGTAQKKWLIATLKEIAAERKTKGKKALILSTHHPPYSSGGHSGSTEMLADIDDACNKAGIMPDLFLSGHAHSYQRYTRRLSFNGKSLSIPYIVCGIGGFNAQAIAPAAGQVTGDHSYDTSHHGYGYLLIEVSKTHVSVKGIGVTPDTQARQEFDAVTVNL